MVNQDIGYHLKELSQRVSSIENRMGKLDSTQIDTDWDNATLMKNWGICKRTAANYRKNGLDYFKRGGRIYYTLQQRIDFINNKKSTLNLKKS